VYKVFLQGKILSYVNGNVIAISLKISKEGGWRKGVNLF
jgi:hypothetical protein